MHVSLLPLRHALTLLSSIPARANATLVQTGSNAPSAKRRKSASGGGFAATITLLAAMALGVLSGGNGDRVQAAYPKRDAVTMAAFSGGGDSGGAISNDQAAMADTLLDEVGHLNRTVPEAQAQAWMRELHYTPAALLSTRRGAWLHLRVGEWKLAKNEEPIQAAWHFDVARKRVSAADPLHGQAIYNKGVARFWNCDYKASAEAFRFLISKKSQVRGGFIPSRATLWLSHAQACEGYHADHAKLGIPQPPRLDPECAAAGLAMCFKRLSLPYDRKSVLPHIRVTGHGSNAGDVETACRNITRKSLAEPNSVFGKAFGKGVTARVIIASEAALRVMPLPALAFVEHDHYVTLLSADKAGVTYSCSDCGPWPGDLVRLSWNQWRRMDLGAVISIVKKGSAEDEALSIVLGEKAGEKPLVGGGGVSRAQKVSMVAQALAKRFGALRRVASTTAMPVATSASGQGAAHVQQVAALVRRMTLGVGYNAVVMAWKCPNVPKDDTASRGDGDGGDSAEVNTGVAATDPEEPCNPYNCGGDLFSLRCTFATFCPTYDCGQGQGGPSCHDPVNLATLEEEYTPEPDLVVYNPSGPSISWSRIYNSMRSPDDWYINYAPSGLGPGWSHSYNIQMFPYNSDGTQPTSLILQNGARIPLTLPAGGATVAGASVGIPAGLPFKVTWNVDAITSGRFFLITWKDGSKWRIGPDGVEGIRDAFGRSLFFERLNYELHIRRDSPTGQVLFTVFYGYGTNRITAVRDNFSARDSSNNVCGRIVYYNYSYEYEGNDPSIPTDNIGFDTLAEVSHVALSPSTFSRSAPASTGITGWRYRYDYGSVKMGNNLSIPTLTTFLTPAPSGSATVPAVSVATLTYKQDGTMYVASHKDANLRITTFDRVDATHTKVDRAGQYKFITGYDNLMSKTSQTDNSVGEAGVTPKLVFQASYATSDYYPSSVTDATGVTASFVYDSFGNVVTATAPPHGGGAAVITTKTYDYAVFPLGRVTDISDGSRTVHIDYVTSGSPLAVQKVTYPSPTGSGTEEVQLTYDTLGNVLTVVAPGNSASATRTTTFNYASDVNIGGGAYAPLGGGIGRRGQPLSVTVSGTGISQTVAHLRYDDRGNVVESWGLKKSSTEALYGYTKTFYNVADQVLEADLPARSASAPGVYGYSTTDYLYVGGPVTSVKFYDETGAMIRQATPKWGKEGESLGGQAPSTSNIATQVLDDVYRPVSITDGGGNTTNYDYWTGGANKSRLKAVRLPGNTTGMGADSIQFTAYDDQGRLTERISGNNGKSFFAYNTGVLGDGALTGVSYQNVGSGFPPVLMASYAYDGYGRLTGRTDSSGTETRLYNASDALTSVTTTYLGAGGTSSLPSKNISYAYNPDGSRMSMTVPPIGMTSGTFTYSYDGLGRPTGMSNPYGHGAGWGYFDNNALKTQTVGVGGTALHTSYYDANGLGQLKSLVNQQGSVASPGSVLSQFDSTLYDGAGNLTQVIRQVTAAATPSSYSDTMAFQYNAKDELTQEKFVGISYTTNYAYDNAGNPTTFRGAPTRAYNNKNQLTTAGTGGGYVYDGNGNPTTYNGASLTFDANDNPTSLPIGSGITAGYTSEGLRAWKQTNSGSVRTYFLYDGADPVMEMDTAGNAKAVNTFGAAGLVSRYNASAGTSVFYTFDETGNVSQRLDGTGALLSTHAFQAYGRHGSTLAGNANPDPWGYKAQSGYYTDQETGLVLCTFRYYDPANGRWINRDPIGYAGGLNLYAYCGGNPVMGIDPSGLINKIGDDGNIGGIGSATLVVGLCAAGAVGSTTNPSNSVTLWDHIRANLPSLNIQWRWPWQKNAEEKTEDKIEDNSLAPGLYRGGKVRVEDVTPREGIDDGDLSTRSGPHNPWPLTTQYPPLRPGQPYVIIDPTALPPGTIIPDNQPPGHVTIRDADPQAVFDAIIGRGRWPKK